MSTSSSIMNHPWRHGRAPRSETGLTRYLLGYHTPIDFDEFMKYICNDFRTSSIENTDCSNNLKIFFFFFQIKNDAVGRTSSFKMYAHKRSLGILCLSVLAPERKTRSLRDAAAVSPPIIFMQHTLKGRSTLECSGFPYGGWISPRCYAWRRFSYSVKVTQKGPHKKKLHRKMTDEQIADNNTFYLEVGKTSPMEFARKPRDPVLNMNYLKSTEGRQIGF